MNRALSVAAVGLLCVGLVFTSHLAVYGSVAFLLFAMKTTLGATHKTRCNEPPKRRVAVIIPVYNEDPEYVRRSLQSILMQTVRPEVVIVVDDGSATPDGFTAANAMGGAMQRAGVKFAVMRQRNAGKREALARGFRYAPDVDIYLCVDSDTILRRNALEEALRPFADQRVTASTGLVLAANHGRNVLTRLIDMRYACAFLIERAAYSALGSVLCCCGSLAMYRADVVHRHLDEFLSQRFLGRPQVFGDDRHMTNLCLLEGRVVFQDSAVAYTAVPERIGHYLRQQIRWNKSFFRESLWVIQRMPWGAPLALTIIELSSWLVLTALLVISMTVRPLHDGVTTFSTYFALIAVTSWVRSVRAFTARSGDVTWRDRAYSFAIAPLYGMLSIFLLLPLRLYSLATLRRGSWGTRQVVEVTV